MIYYQHRDTESQSFDSQFFSVSLCLCVLNMETSTNQKSEIQSTHSLELINQQRDVGSEQAGGDGQENDTEELTDEVDTAFT